MTHLLLSLSLTWAVLCSARVAVSAEPDVAAAFTAAAERMTELAHEARIAKAWREAGLKVETEVHTADNARCDLVTETTAYELDWAHKWAECGGQAIYYSIELKRKPGMVLLVTDADERFVARAKVVAEKIKAELIIVKVEGDVPLPAGAAKPKAATAEEPHLTATVADRGCPPCERWERETLPALLQAGWRVEVIRVPYGSQATPEFRFGGNVLEGYSGRLAFMNWLRDCEQ